MNRFSQIFICFIYFSLVFSKRLYVHQFEPGTEHLLLPNIILFSLYMGNVSYPHLPLLFESMRWNPTVHFTIINIITESDDSEHLVYLKSITKLDNLSVIRLTLNEWSKRVNSRLNVTVNFTKDWYYKLCDYKPAIAYLFPELVTKKYKFWGTICSVYTFCIIIYFLLQAMVIWMLYGVISQDLLPGFKAVQKIQGLLLQDGGDLLALLLFS